MWAARRGLLHGGDSAAGVAEGVLHSLDAV